MPIRICEKVTTTFSHYTVEVPVSYRNPTFPRPITSGLLLPRCVASPLPNHSYKLNPGTNTLAGRLSVRLPLCRSPNSPAPAVHFWSYCFFLDSITISASCPSNCLFPLPLLSSSLVLSYPTSPIFFIFDGLRLYDTQRVVIQLCSTIGPILLF